MSCEIIALATNVFRSVKPNSKVIVDYDDVEDVLYVNYQNSPVQAADFGRRFGDYIVRVKNGFVIGVTILDAKLHFEKKFADKPLILSEPVTIRIA